MRRGKLEMAPARPDGSKCGPGPSCGSGLLLMGSASRSRCELLHGWRYDSARVRALSGDGTEESASHGPRNLGDLVRPARSRLLLVKPIAGSVGPRRPVSIAGWAKHAILYEFSSLKAAEANLTDPSEWTRRVIGNLVHAPHSPTLGVRIWPAVQEG